MKVPSTADLAGIIREQGDVLAELTGFSVKTSVKRKRGSLFVSVVVSEAWAARHSFSVRRIEDVPAAFGDLERRMACAVDATKQAWEAQFAEVRGPGASE